MTMAMGRSLREADVAALRPAGRGDQRTARRRVVAGERAVGKRLSTWYGADNHLA